MSLGERIYRYRTQKNLSQGDLAQELDVSRQSISKWETDTSVPELDKLIKLSQIFGVSLDELVLDAPAAQAAPEEPKVIYVEKAAEKSSGKTAGTVLLCTAAVVWLLLTVFGGIVAGLILALPFLFCGLICLCARKHAGLWCAWTVYLFVECYFRFATGVTWQFVFQPYVYTGGYTVHLIVAWIWVFAYVGMIALTVARFYKSTAMALRTNALTAGIAWGVYAIINVVFSLALQNLELEAEILRFYRIMSTASGWVCSILIVLAVVYTARLLSSIKDRRKEE